MSLPMYVQTNWAILNEMVSGDSGTILDLTCYDLQGNVVDLSSVATAWLRFKVASGVAQVRQMAMPSPLTQGRVLYQFQSADTANQSGLCQYEVLTKDLNGNVLNTQLTPGLFRVRAPIA